MLRHMLWLQRGTLGGVEFCFCKMTSATHIHNIIITIEIIKYNFIESSSCEHRKRPPCTFRLYRMPWCPGAGVLSEHRWGACRSSKTLQLLTSTLQVSSREHLNISHSSRLELLQFSCSCADPCKKVSAIKQKLVLLQFYFTLF